MVSNSIRRAPGLSRMTTCTGKAIFCTERDCLSADNSAGISSFSEAEISTHPGYTQPAPTEPSAEEYMIGPELFLQGE